MEAYFFMKVTLYLYGCSFRVDIKGEWGNEKKANFILKKYIPLD